MRASNTRLLRRLAIGGLAAAALPPVAMLAPHSIVGIAGAFFVIGCTLMWGRKGGFFSATWAGLAAVLHSPTMTEYGIETVVSGAITYFVIGLGMGHAIDNIREQRNRSAENEERFRGIFEESPIAIEIFDAAGRLELANQACLDMFGVSSVDDARGFNIFSDPNIPDDARERLARGESVRYESPFSFDLVHELRLYPTSKHGTCFLNCIITPLGSTGSHPGGYLVQVRDVTERATALRDLREANQKLAGWVEALEQRESEMIVLNELGELLQSCVTPEEAFSVVSSLGPRLFPNEAGAVFIISASRNLVELMSSWGRPSVVERVFQPTQCWALRRGRLHVVTSPEDGPRCDHMGLHMHSSYLCAPLMAQGEALGMLYLEAAPEAGPLPEARQRLAVTVAEHISLAVANLRLRETLRNQAIRDPLTSLFNRRYMEETLEREVRRSARRATSLAIIMLDIDHFKRFNDTFGHAAGDALLQTLGPYINGHLRVEDIACRYGGEEFTLILPEAPLDVAVARAEQLREGVSKLVVEHRGERLGFITLSAGVATYPDHGGTGEAVMVAADMALYRAKSNGRNRVIAADTPKQ